MTYEEMISEVSKTTGFNERKVKKIYDAYWKTIKDYISNLDLKRDMTDEEFNNLKVNVNVCYLGKFYVTLDRFKGKRKKHHYIQELIKKKNAAYQENNPNV